MNKFLLISLLISLTSPAAWGKVTVGNTTAVPAAELKNFAHNSEEKIMADLHEAANNSMTAKIDMGRDVQLKLQALDGQAQINWSDLQVTYKNQKLDLGWQF
jgi:hypothetical protein